MDRKLISADEIAEGLKSLEGWTVDGKTLKRRYEFDNFADALRFVNKVGEVAEGLDHHPDISFGWGYAEIATTTHDRGGITDMDTTLAATIAKLT